MPLPVGTRLGLYEIVAPLGAGGMGEVYRARDTKLGRSVAVKILPDAFALVPDRLARFEREAKVLASLNHPHITALHGMEESEGRHFLVMELVEGETLADAIAAKARGPGAPRGLETDDALTIARQIADALEAAHEQGIIHRDLKPANIKLRPDGTVKVLDFGLAKALEPTSSIRGDVTSSPTITTPAMTQLGIILGTAAYMSPEQAKGRPADKRSDVWAFGCVLFEMLTGRRAFEGDDVSDTLATVLKGEPDWTALPSDLPDAIRALIQGCLRKDRRERIGDLSAARFLLNQPRTVTPNAPLARLPARAVWKRAIPVVVSVLIGAVVAAAVLVKLKPTPTVAVTRFVITLPAGQQLTLPRQAIDISRDGTRIVYVAEGRVYLRSLSEVEARAIPGAEPAVGPVFSPDGQSVAFWADGVLKRIAISGGTPITICPIGGAPSGIAWGDDAILFGQSGTGIMRVLPIGGNPQIVVALGPSEALGHGPQLLPDGVTLLFTIARRVEGADAWENAQIVVQSLKTGERKTIVDRATDARYVPTGHIVYAVGGTLFAVPFDLATLATTAGAVPIVEGVRRVNAVSSGGVHFAFSNSGSLVYLAGPVSAAQQNLMLFDRKGGAEALALPPGPYRYPRVAPDGKRVVFETNDTKEANVSVFELSGASSVRRLTFGGNNRYPIWSADGRHVAFQSDRDGALSIFRQAADGGLAERLTTPDPGTAHYPESWSANGDTFLFSVKKGSEWSLWSFSMRDRKATPFGGVRSTTFPTDAVFSPDGRWVAYQVGEPGASEATTYIEPFPQTGAKYQVARGGRPQWSRDGTELFYVPAPSQFMAVTVRTQPSVTFANPVTVPRGFGIADPANTRPYDITPDGRILGVGTGQTSSGSPGPAQIQVVLNWFEELKTRAPTK
jgi:hypothetical protein